MPELPEVEIFARELRSDLVGQRVTTVEVRWPAIVASHPPDAFAALLLGTHILDVARRGKYLLFPLSTGETLIVHLRMTGRFFLAPSPQRGKHVHVLMALSNGKWLHYQDVRKFGRFYLEEDPQRFLGPLGPEPLDPTWTAALFWRALQKHRLPVKAALLNQRIVAGLGNIYADEALFAAGIDPRRPANALSREDVLRLQTAIRRLLAAAIRARGSSVRDYLPPNGVPGTFRAQHQVYHHTGEPCPRCGTPLQRVRISGRSTHFCPHCQR